MYNTASYLHNRTILQMSLMSRSDMWTLLNTRNTSSSDFFCLINRFCSIVKDRDHSFYLKSFSLWTIRFVFLFPIFSNRASAFSDKIFLHTKKDCVNCLYPSFRTITEFFYTAFLRTFPFVASL